MKPNFILYNSMNIKKFNVINKKLKKLKNL